MAAAEQSLNFFNGEIAQTMGRLAFLLHAGAWIDPDEIAPGVSFIEDRAQQGQISVGALPNWDSCGRILYALVQEYNGQQKRRTLASIPKSRNLE